MIKRSSRHVLAEVHQDSRMPANSNLRKNLILRQVLNAQADSRPVLRNFLRGEVKTE
jgi:hypothetical protein